MVDVTPDVTQQQQQQQVLFADYFHSTPDGVHLRAILVCLDKSDMDAISSFIIASMMKCVQSVHTLCYQSIFYVFLFCAWTDHP